MFGGLTKVHLAPCHLHATRCQKPELCCSEALTDGYWLKPQHQPDIYRYLISPINVSAYNLHVFLGWCSHFFERNLWFDVSLALFALSNAFFVCISKSLLLIISPGTSSYIPQKQLGTQFVASASALKLTVIISLLADIHFDQSQIFSVCVGYCNLFARLYSTPLQKPWFGKGISTHGMTEGGCSILGGRD